MISIVVPIFNEEESLQAFYDELKLQLTHIPREHEILFIDDGSSDNSLEILKRFEKKDNTVRVFSFRKNQGKAEALTLGFQKAKGKIIITLDADLQDKPAEIAKLLKKLQDNSLDLVSGWRKDRKDKSKMVVISRIFNYLTGILFGIRLHDYNCGLKAYTEDAAKSLHLYGGQHRFIPILLHQQGFLVDEIVVEHEERKFGKSKYGFSKIKDLPDMFTMLFLARYSKRPLHLFGPVGGLLFMIGLGIFGYLGLVWLGGESIGRRPLFFTSIFLMLGGLQIFFSGFLAELITNSAQKDYFPPLKYSSD